MNKKLVNIMLIMALTITLIMAINAFVASAQDPGFEVEGGEITETYEDFEDIPEEFLEEALVEEEIIIEEAGITPDSPFYFVDEIIDTITLAAAEGEEKAEKAAEIAAEKVAEAKLMADKNLTDETLEALENANVSGLVEGEVSPELRELTKEKMEFINKILAELEDIIPEDFDEIKALIDSQKTQADKNRIAADIADKISDLCNELALENYDLMLEEPRCDPENAPEWLGKYIEEDINKRQEEATQMVLEILTQCIEDPRECDCDKIPVESEKRKCKENSALAVRCEYEQDMKACHELDGKEDEFLDDLPEFMRDIVIETFESKLNEKEGEMFDKFAPPECKKAGATTREECEDIMMDIHGPPPKECMEGGEFIGPEECDEIMEELHGPTPPECKRDGEYIGEDECGAALVAAGKMPNECVNGGQFIGFEECDGMMKELHGPPPKECMEDGKFIGENECRTIMDEQLRNNKAESPECYNGDVFIGNEACRAIMEGLYGDEWAKAREESPECYDGDEYVGDEACRAISEELYGDDFTSGKKDSPECYEGDVFIGDDACQAIMEELYPDMHKGKQESPECYDGDEYIGDEICHALMEAKFAAEKKGMEGPGFGDPDDLQIDCTKLSDEECQELKWEKMSVISPMRPGEEGDSFAKYGEMEKLGFFKRTESGQMMIMGENGAEYITKEDLGKIYEKFKSSENTEDRNYDRFKDLTNEIDQLERQKEGNYDDHFIEDKYNKYDKQVDEGYQNYDEERHTDYEDNRYQDYNDGGYQDYNDEGYQDYDDGGYQDYNNGEYKNYDNGGDYQNYKDEEYNDAGYDEGYEEYVEPEIEYESNSNNY
ncbi:hypothetical protein HOC35_00820 [Candidatus Woesearchaeota archaeon]|jgi:DNA-directed RNA polymerase subunit F|nr:hypothetical protein [Candidatus Woesearchaeota archaeon]